MLELSSSDQSVSPPVVTIPRRFNLAHDLLQRHLKSARAGKLAYIDDQGAYTYGALADRVDRCASSLRRLGLQPEQRILLCLTDTIDFPVAFLGSIKAGIVPVCVNTQLTPADYRHFLEDSRARAVVVSASLLPVFDSALEQSQVLHRIVSGGTPPTGAHALSDLLDMASPMGAPQETCADEPCFWLYSSGSTGPPKGTVHAHASPILTAELYARPVLGIREDDVIFSAAKLFFAYGLGNSLSFPLAVGATAILTAERPTPAVIFERLTRHRPTLFCAVPTLYAGLLAWPEAPARETLRLRTCASAGECLPPAVGQAWQDRYGVEILDGIGSTEMLHIFISNRPGAVEYGTTGLAVPGYEARLVDEAGHPVEEGEIGELQVAGPTAALHYWNNREKSRHTFQGHWTRTGDRYYLNPRGRFVHAGRADDMLKVGGIFVSPVEVESALISHPAVLEAAVVAQQDLSGLVKPIAFVVPKPGFAASAQLASDLQIHVRGLLAHYKNPRWIEFCTELPKTATGKVQRFRLREMCQTPRAVPGSSAS